MEKNEKSSFTFDSDEEDVDSFPTERLFAQNNSEKHSFFSKKKNNLFKWKSKLDDLTNEEFKYSRIGLTYLTENYPYIKILEQLTGNFDVILSHPLEILSHLFFVLGFENNKSARLEKNFFNILERNLTKVLIAIKKSKFEDAKYSFYSSKYNSQIFSPLIDSDHFETDGSKDYYRIRGLEYFLDTKINNVFDGLGHLILLHQTLKDYYLKIKSQEKYLDFNQASYLLLSIKEIRNFVFMEIVSVSHYIYESNIANSVSKIKNLHSQITEQETIADKIQKEIANEKIKHKSNISEEQKKLLAQYSLLNSTLSAAVKNIKRYTNTSKSITEEIFYLKTKTVKCKLARSLYLAKGDLKLISKNSKDKSAAEYYINFCSYPLENLNKELLILKNLSALVELPESLLLYTQAQSIDYHLTTFNKGIIEISATNNSYSNPSSKSYFYFVEKFLNGKISVETLNSLTIADQHKLGSLLIFFQRLNLILDKEIEKLSTLLTQKTILNKKLTAKLEKYRSEFSEAFSCEIKNFENNLPSLKTSIEIAETRIQTIIANQIKLKEKCSVSSSLFKEYFSSFKKYIIEEDWENFSSLCDDDVTDLLRKTLAVNADILGLISEHQRGKNNIYRKASPSKAKEYNNSFFDSSEEELFRVRSKENNNDNSSQEKSNETFSNLKI